MKAVEGKCGTYGMLIPSRDFLTLMLPEHFPGATHTVGLGMQNKGVYEFGELQPFMSRWGVGVQHLPKTGTNWHHSAHQAAQTQTPPIREHNPKMRIRSMSAVGGDMRNLTPSSMHDFPRSCWTGPKIGAGETTSLRRRATCSQLAKKTQRRVAQGCALYRRQRTDHCKGQERKRT
jgi:hypothetical protein